MSENLYQPNFSMPEFKSLQPAPGGILINFLEQHPDGSSPDEEFNRRLLITKEGENY